MAVRVVRLSKDQVWAEKEATQWQTDSLRLVSREAVRMQGERKSYGRNDDCQGKDVVL